MKVFPISRINNNIKYAVAALTLASAPLTLAKTPEKDIFVGSKSECVNSIAKPDVVKTIEVTPSGTTEKAILDSAPSPIVTIKGESKSAVIVIDLSKNVLYHYDKSGNPLAAYLVASGKPSAPTQNSVRVVSHVETFPYSSAPRNTKRHKQPYCFGPKAIILNLLDPITGVASQSGIFIHGNNDPSSIGKYASLGCIRMDNEVIQKLAKQVHNGDIVVMNRYN